MNLTMNFFMALKLRYKRLIDNGMNEKDAQEECKNELKYANDVILKACEEDKEGLGKLGYENNKQRESWNSSLSYKKTYR